MSHQAVLMSIKPKYADLIFAGTKTIELRRVCPKVALGDLVLVYVSSPRMALVGGFEVAGIVSADPLALCKKWQAQSGVEKETFLNYFHGAATAYGILIGRTWQFESATELQTLRRRKGGFHPPQSYRYLKSEELVKLMNLLCCGALWVSTRLKSGEFTPACRHENGRCTVETCNEDKFPSRTLRLA
jgi:predicted transcriptional regulator